MKLACFGDSITAGQYLTDSDTFASKLADRFKCEVINAGVPGNTTGQGLARFERDVLEHRPDICVIAFGMNDHVNKEPGTAKTPLPEFRGNLTHIIERLRANDIVPVLCTANPIIEGDEERYYYRRHPKEWYRNPSGAQAWIDLYNEEIRALAGSLGVALADVALRWRQYTEQGGQLDDLLRTVENSGTDDGVHPTAAGQELFAACIGETLEPLIRS
jgi:lysophospholipase L1-like esterase